MTRHAATCLENKFVPDLWKLFPPDLCETVSLLTQVQDHWPDYGSRM